MECNDPINLLTITFLSVEANECGVLNSRQARADFAEPHNPNSLECRQIGYSAIHNLERYLLRPTLANGQ
jgi:hypothetical protein